MIHLAVGRSARSNRITGQYKLTDFSDLVELIRGYPLHVGKLTVSEYQEMKAAGGEEAKKALADKDYHWFSMARYGVPIRKAENVKSVSGWVGDFDKGTLTPEQISDRLGDVSHIIYTTYSHTEEHPKYRVLVPYSRGVTVEEHAKLFDYFNDFFEGAVDKQTCDPCRLWFFPSHAADGPEG